MGGKVFNNALNFTPGYAGRHRTERSNLFHMRVVSLVVSVLHLYQKKEECPNFKLSAKPDKMSAQTETLKL